MKINLTKITTYTIIIFIISLFFIGLNKSNIYDTKYLIGKKIDSFNLNSLTSEKKISNLDLEENKFTLINFWASWCGPCRDEHKYLLELKNQHNIKILGINFKDKKNNALDFLSTLGNPYYLIAKDKKGKSSVQFGIYGIPESILINSDLKILKKFVGPLNSLDVKEILKFTK